MMETKKMLGPAGTILARWLDDHRQTPRKLAIQLDVDQSIVYGWIWGRSLPSLRNAFRLEQVTGIPAETWLTEPVAEAASAAL